MNKREDLGQGDSSDITADESTTEPNSEPAPDHKSESADLTATHPGAARRAFIASIPVMTGYVFLGIGFGILLQNAGLGVGWALAMSLGIYSGATQFVAIPLLATGASFATVALTAFMVGSRHLFYGLSLIDKYRSARWRKPYLVYALTDETYSLVTQDPEGLDGKDKLNYYFLLTLFNQSYWVAGSVIGALVGDVLPFNTEGIDFALTALFLTIVTDQWLKVPHGRGHVPALIGFATSVVCLAIFGPDNFLIPTMLIILVALLLGKNTLEAEARERATAKAENASNPAYPAASAESSAAENPSVPTNPRDLTIEGGDR